MEEHQERKKLYDEAKKRDDLWCGFDLVDIDGFSVFIHSFKVRCLCNRRYMLNSSHHERSIEKRFQDKKETLRCLSQ